MSPKDQTKVRKLIALALDGRGSAKEADAAALKALRMCRAANITEDDFAGIFGGAVDHEEETARPVVDPIEAAIANAVHAFMGSFVKGFHHG